MANHGERFHGYGQRAKGRGYRPSDAEPRLSMAFDDLIDQAMPLMDDQVLPSMDTDMDMDVDMEMTETQADYYLNLSLQEASRREGSNTADDVSYINIQTPSGVSEAFSFEMVRSNSDKSNQISEGSDNKLFSTPSHGSADNLWSQGAECRVDTEASMPHDRNTFFFDLDRGRFNQ